MNVDEYFNPLTSYLKLFFLNGNSYVPTWFSATVKEK